MRLKAKKESPSPNIIMQNKIQMKQFQRDQTLVEDIHHSATIFFLIVPIWFSSCSNIYFSSCSAIY